MSNSSVNLGNPMRTLATQELSPSSVLPMCDDLWDQGGSVAFPSNFLVSNVAQILSSDEPFTLSSPASLQIGRFARFAQATFLLGRVYERVSDSTLSKDFLEEEATQLRRTLQALAKIVDIEGQGRKLQFCTQAALCYSGMLLLQESYSCMSKAPSPDIHFWDPTVSIAESTAREAARIATAFLSRDDVGPATEKVSPFILHLFYHAQVIYSEKAKRAGI
ncbi:hypothetical protein BDZ45DRAFT_267259 [Acephala macrosclerotiorum]|nr:hypothetical protein BDZ45DRAFT_267259 [Acephala macrosclerotiorum]